MPAFFHLFSRRTMYSDGIIDLSASSRDETDEKCGSVDCYAFDNIAMNTSEYCHKGDIVGVKGRIQRIDSTSELQLIAEKVTFLSSKSPED